MIHSFLMIGQSNMAGRGFAAEVTPIDTKNLLVLRNGVWTPMFVPVNPDRPTAGISLAESFARCYADDHPDVQVGLIPCADGGTGIRQWMPGELLFDHAVMAARLAMRTSQLMGILWHQGETDCINGDFPRYAENCTAMLTELRRQLGLPNVPLLLGQLGDFLSNCQLNTELRNYRQINRALQTVAHTLPNTRLVSAEGLEANDDQLHFNASALRTFGTRYYRDYCRLAD